MKPGPLVLLGVLGLSALSGAQESTRERDARMKWWREARFGMFIHWGLYAKPAGIWKGRETRGIGEWIMQNLHIPVDDYAAIAPTFDPVSFDATRWVAVAKAAGMKYIVMTAKHHEGFAMFDSADPFSIERATPFHRDPIAEMAAACKKAGLKFGVYYSQAQDWHHPGGAAYGGHWDPKQDGDLHAYVRNVAAPQLQELMRYHPAVLWWDTPVEMSKEDIALLTAPLPKSIITNNRLGNGVAGDTETPEQTIPPTGFPGRDWETCMTINDTWGYKANDHNFKSTETLLRNLIDIASKGGNYLLNVGPDAKGVIPQPEIDRLEAVGAWLKANGRSIYGTSASPYRRLAFNGRVTRKGNSMFVNVFEWPANGQIVLPGLQTLPTEVRSVATGEKCAFSTADGAITVSTPKSTDPVSTAIELRFAQPPVVEQTEAVIAIANGTTELRADDADLTGGLQVEHTPSNIGYWTDANDSVSWKVDAKAAVRAGVRLEYACAAGAGGSTISVRVDGKDVGIGTVLEETGAWDSYRKVELPGELSLSPGRHEIRIVATAMPHGAVMNLRRLVLGPRS